MISEFKNEHRFLSNFWPCEINYEGINYSSVEHAYQAAKTDDIIIKKQIANLSTPGKAKRFGNNIIQIKEFPNTKITIMNKLVNMKFSNDIKLLQMLLDTKDEFIVEGNTWHDNFWGSCYCDRCGNQGRNVLGKILMLVRDNLK